MPETSRYAMMKMLEPGEFGGYVPTSTEELDFLREYDPSKFPIIVSTVDMIVHTDTSVLLIKRGGFPYKGYWALPGGFINPDETTAQAALRELKEEAGVLLSEQHIEFVGVADHPTRDPRGRAISTVYAAHVAEEYDDLYAGDDAVDAQWFTFTEAMESMRTQFAFDHGTILYLFLHNFVGRQ